MKAFCSLILILGGILISPASEAINYRQLSKGAEYGVLHTGPQNTTLHLLKLDLKKVRVRPIDSRDFNAGPMTAQEMALTTGALAVINANFFEEGGKPLGLVLQDGKIKNPFHKTDWWASILIRRDRARILRVYDPKQIAGFENGVQAGPRLVIGGVIPKLKDNLSSKSAVGINKNGQLIFIATEGPLTSRDFANLLQKPEAEGGIGLQDALNLDGGSSTQFFIKVGEFELWLPGVAKVPVGLGVFKK